MTGLDIDEQVADAMARLGATGRKVLRRTDKTTAVDAVWSGRRAVVKVLTTTDAYWRARRHREAQTYAAFATTPPPFAVPMLLHDEDGIRVLDHADAAPLHTDRYPAEPLDRDAVTAAVTALLSVAAWPGTGLPAADYHHMLDQTSPPCDRGAVAAVLDRITSPLVTQHGDPLPSNLLLTGERRCVLVDFEHSGQFLPGYDLAVLTCLLAGQPDEVRLVVADAAATVDPACFAINLCLAADRETRIHWAFEPDDERRRRLALLDIVADSATRALRRL